MLAPWKENYKKPAAAAAAIAKSPQSCPTLCDPIDGSPPGSRVPGILQARTLEWVVISFSNAWKWEVKVKSLSRVRLLAAPWTAAYQAPPSMGVSRQEYWSGVPSPSPRQCIKKQSHHFADKGPYSQSYGFSSCHVQMWELDNKESWPPKNWWFWIVVLENILNSPLDYKPVNPKGNQPWILIRWTDAEAEALILWPPDVKSWLIGKDTDAGKNWGQEEQEAEGEMVRWHHQLSGHEFEQTPGDSERQQTLVCCSPWGRKESDLS